MKARQVKKLDPGGPLAENSARIVGARLDELLSLAPKALKSGGIEAQHDMRIAAKRLRYVLELTGFCFGPAGDAARRRARDLQDILGEMHDCDLMLPRALDHLAALRTEDARSVLARAGNMPDLDPKLAAQAPHRTAYRGVEVLAVYLQARRELLFTRFGAFWARQEEVGTWVRLETAAELQLARAREARRARLAEERARAQAEAAERAAAAEAKRARLERDRVERETAEHSEPSRYPRASGAGAARLDSTQRQDDSEPQPAEPKQPPAESAAQPRSPTNPSVRATEANRPVRVDGPLAGPPRDGRTVGEAGRGPP